MKSNKGITLISLIIYVIVFSLVVAIASTLTRYFYRNIDEAVISNNTSEQYARFVTYITQDINSKKIDDVFVGKDGTYINLYFKDETVHQYAYSKDNKKIYYIAQDSKKIENNKIELCSQIEECKFELKDMKIITKIKINSIMYNNTYVINE